MTGGRGKGRGRGRGGTGKGRGRGAAATPPETTPTTPSAETNRPKDLDRRYSFEPADDNSPPSRPLTQTQLNVSRFPPPPLVLQNNPTGQQQRPSSESPQSRSQPHTPRPSRPTGQLSTL